MYRQVYVLYLAQIPQMKQLSFVIIILFRNIILEALVWMTIIMCVHFLLFFQKFKYILCIQTARTSINDNVVDERVKTSTVIQILIIVDLIKL